MRDGKWAFAEIAGCWHVCHDYKDDHTATLAACGRTVPSTATWRRGWTDVHVVCKTCRAATGDVLDEDDGPCTAQGGGVTHATILTGVMRHFGHVRTVLNLRCCPALGVWAEERDTEPRAVTCLECLAASEAS